MSKALVIKTANFSENALTTIEFADVPCTGLSFAEDTITISGYGTEEIEYTVTPADTTDAVEWASSNTDIVTVSDGVLTVVGIGTCTVTATCGSFYASATITVSITYIPNWQFAYLSHPNGALYATISANMSRLAACGGNAQAGEYVFLKTSNPEESVPVIKIPGNTASIMLSRDTTKTNIVTSGNYHSFTWMSDEPCGNTSYSYAAKFISESDAFNFFTESTKTLAVPEGADAFGITIRLISTYSDSDDPNQIAANAGGFQITFNPITE